MDKFLALISVLIIVSVGFALLRPNIALSDEVKVVTKGRCYEKIKLDVLYELGGQDKSNSDAWLKFDCIDVCERNGTYYKRHSCPEDGYLTCYCKRI